MRKRKNYLSDPVVTALDRASQAQYRLEALIARVEEAIFQEKEVIRADYPLEESVSTMSHKLLQYLQQKQNSPQSWRQVGIGEIIDMVHIKPLVLRIWPELHQLGHKKKGRGDEFTS